MQDNDLVKKIQKIMNGEIGKNFLITHDGMLVMKGRICVPSVDDLRNAIMEEAYSYNYSYQASISMAPYRALYERKFQTPLCWKEIGVRKLKNVELIEATSKKIKIIRNRLKVA